MTSRIAITGIGIVSPHGSDCEAAFERIVVGQSAIACWDRADVVPVPVATSPFDVTRWFTRLQLAGVDRVSQFAVAAAQMAREDSRVTLPEDRGRIGVYVGSGMGGAGAIDDAYDRFHHGGRVPPLSVPAGMTNACAAHVAMREGAHGPVYTYSVACASSGIAIAEAAKAIAAGEIDVAYAGGSEALLVPGVVRAWQALQALARPHQPNPSASCRPFAADRDGLVLGEGAAFLILETERAAIARGARIYALVGGSGVSCDASHLTKPDAAGQIRAMRAALRASGLAPSDIGYCNAHGTATVAGDIVEADALRTVWGEAISSLRVSSTKAVHGHLLGAAGALEAVISVMSLYRRRLPTNAHCETPDPKCALNLVTVGCDAPELNAVISNSFAFGGTNVALVFTR